MTKPKQEIQQVYFLYGPESYLIEKEVQRLLDQTLAPKERGLNLHIFDGDEQSGQEIAQAAQTLPMFSKYRFVLVNEADRMEEDNVEALLRYIRDPSPTTCLVMVGQTAGSWKRHQAAVEKVGKAVEYGRLKGRGLASWIKKRMEEKGKTISEEAVDYLMEVVGDHLQDHENALEKISLSVKEKRSMALSDIEGIVSEVKISTIFDLTEAIGQQNLEKALGILEKTLESKAIPFRKDEETSKKMEDPIPLLLSMMARQYRLIWRVKELLAHHQGSGEVAKVLRMSPWNVKKLMDQGRKFSVAFLREAILRCHQTDMAVKRGRGPKNLLMEKLVIDLCRPG
jgi:DNA polymerase-3 subunit delta